MSDVKVKLKRGKISNKFGVLFPKDVPMKYSKDLECVEHPKHKNIWIRVKSSEFILID